jgi:NAD(P)H dehydrogenase (quinone)
MSSGNPILVTGAAGRVGGVGGAVVEALRRRGLPVRALVRRDDERADDSVICWAVIPSATRRR